jgi:hypothetical protein
MADELIGGTSFEVLVVAALMYGATHEYAGGNPFPGPGGDFMPWFVDYADRNWDRLSEFISRFAEDAKATIESGRTASGRSERFEQPAAASLVGLSYWDLMAIYRAQLSRYSGYKLRTH